MSGNDHEILVRSQLGGSNETHLVTMVVDDVVKYMPLTTTGRIFCFWSQVGPKCFDEDEQ